MIVRRDGVIRTAPVTYDAARGDGITATIVSARRYNGTTAPVVVDVETLLEGIDTYSEDGIILADLQFVCH